MRLFIKMGTMEKLIRKAIEGGGFIQAEILVTNNFELAVPGPERKYWIEFREKKDTVEVGKE